MAEPDKYLVAVNPDGTTTKTMLDDYPTLEQLQGIVGGHMELVPYFNTYEGKSCLAFCNTDGKNIGLPRNKFANDLWDIAVGRKITEDYLVGGIAIVVGPREFLLSM